ncbi:MAG TPA: hypothetical protein VN729_13095, partial [Ktedonobacteraceae bacterium]|nr:hypothetical protein [Ktedonobacteraceae bacterium]
FLVRRGMGVAHTSPHQKEKKRACLQASPGRKRLFNSPVQNVTLSVIENEIHRLLLFDLSALPKYAEITLTQLVPTVTRANV